MGTAETLVQDIIMFVMPNVFIKSIERSGAMDRYGIPVNEPIYTQFAGFIDRSSELVIGPNGETQRIDGIMILDQQFILRVGDLVAIDKPRPEQDTIYDIREYIDDVGNVEYYSYRLVRKLMTR